MICSKTGGTEAFEGEQSKARRFGPMVAARITSLKGVMERGEVFYHRLAGAWRSCCHGGRAGAEGFLLEARGGHRQLPRPQAGLI